MADRLFERAFSQAAAASASEGAERPLQPKRESVQAEAGAADKVPATPMQVSDAVQRVLQADQDKDYFRYMLQVCKLLFTMLLSSQNCWCPWCCREVFLPCYRLMELPQPEADELGRPILTVTQADISKAYRRISVLVHPDKNPGKDARKAFEALNEAHRKLKDPGQLVSIRQAHHPASSVALCSVNKSRLPCLSDLHQHTLHIKTSWLCASVTATQCVLVDNSTVHAG